ncbi:glycosyl transferase [Paraoerskovia sediminicola]|uniref:D-inositol 3-phosphate glycosyltransferase n=1 Tax=Paraoerskovia sediminicola TaxID=1138587 RepID=A0ABM8G2Z6_9CELL|nr:glycosyltransferase family 1 protein [Paraoerskovia sediminicola]BDZ42496.1 glycosyl transferase [Paraoerskovia sediminicola]
MRVAIITESFLPHVNGVTNSVLRVLEHVREAGDQALVIAPVPDGAAPPIVAGAPVVGVGSIRLPGYPDVRVSTATRAQIEKTLGAFEADVVHLASPFVLGHRGILAAEQLGLPTVAVYQTEVPGYAAAYRARHLEPLLWRRVRAIHGRATVNLAPSSATLAHLADRGIPRLRLWGRGVDTERFHPRHRDEAWRARVAGPHYRPGDVLVGYVGRLAAEKEVERLAVLTDLPGVHVVVVGDGPERHALRRTLPRAHFTGLLTGHDLAVAMAGLDVFVHPGEHETFGQALQEAHASGVPVVAAAAGGPIDIVRPSHTGWLYRPGDTEQMRAAVVDLAGDARKRRAFGDAARASTLGRTWRRLGDELMSHYRDAIALHEAGTLPTRGAGA